MKLKLLIESNASVDFDLTNKTKEEFENLSWLNKLLFLEVYADLDDVEIQEFSIVEEDESKGINEK